MALSLRESVCNARRLPKDMDLVMGRAELLHAEDKELLEAILIRGQTAASAGNMMGVSARVVANRVRRLAGRLVSRQFMDAARALRYLPPEEAALARLHYCAGLSERKLARQLRISSHVVRRRLDRISAQIAMIRRMRKSQEIQPLDPHASGLHHLARHGGEYSGRNMK